VKDDGARLVAMQMILNRLMAAVVALPAPYPRHVVFVSSTNGTERARVTTVAAKDLDDLETRLASPGMKHHFAAKYLRLDWVTLVHPIRFDDYAAALKGVKRNYSRKGVSFDPAFRHAVTEAEINGSALLYKGGSVPHCEVNATNFDVYWKRRFGQTFRMPAPAAMVHLFSSEGLFYDRVDGQSHVLPPTGPNTGRRICDVNDLTQIDSLIRRGADYLAGEVGADGQFHYGWYPCFDRPITHNNTLRQASSTYALCEAYGLLKSENLARAIERSLHHLTSERIISPISADGPAYLVDLGNEIKLGGNAVAILALCKHAQATGDQRYLPLARRLGEGILSMGGDDGQYNHVLHADSLHLKERRRTIYYDGEAAFALMRLYHATGEKRWLDAVQQAVQSYIAQDYWQYNDHWLAYCTTELALHDPDPSYFRFGVRNVKEYLEFIAGRVTTFPTLLELCCATRLLIRQALTEPALRHTLAGLDLPAFVSAMEARAQYLANGYFFPEVAMYFRNPAKITGSFFIRHHGFRVRIDDVEHYLSGLIAYRAYLEDRDAFADLIGHNAAELTQG
jgi:hypothetical protein